MLKNLYFLLDDSQDILGSLFIKIYHYYPGDVGCFCIYFFNYLILEPGEAIYLGSNEPHAYISGGMLNMIFNFF